MRNLVIAAAIVGLAAITANCGNSQGSSSASNMFPSITAPSVLEARGGNGNGKGNISPLPPSSVTPEMVSDVVPSGFSWGDTIAINVFTSATETHVTLQCHRNGMVVLSAWAPYVGSSPQWTLSSPSWQGGGANCTADLIQFSGMKDIVLASFSFDVVG